MGSAPSPAGSLPVPVAATASLNRSATSPAAQKSATGEAARPRSSLCQQTSTATPTALQTLPDLSSKAPHPFGTPQLLCESAGAPPLPPSQGGLASAPAAEGHASAAQQSLAVFAHGFEWREKAVPQPIGSPVPRRAWSVCRLSGDIVTEGSDSVGHGRARCPLSYLLTMFPQEQSSRMMQLTSAKLSERLALTTTPGELLRFFGILVLSTFFEFGSGAELWSLSPRTKHVPAPAFGSRTVI